MSAITNDLDVGFTLVEEDKLKIRYIYDYFPYYYDSVIHFQKIPIACVVSNGTQVGISIRNTKIVYNPKKKVNELIDKTFNKQRAKHIATERMYLGSLVDVPNKKINVYVGGVPSLYKNKIVCPYREMTLEEAITYTVNKMLKRS